MFARQLAPRVHQLSATAAIQCQRHCAPVAARYVAAFAPSASFTTSTPLHKRPVPFAPATPNAEHLRTLAQYEDAFEVIDKLPAIQTRLMITCEHASTRLPGKWHWPADDQRLVGQHWSFDAGAKEFTREITGRLSSVAVLARFSRLLCDANRPIGSDTMFRKEADGQPVLLNEPKRLHQHDIDLRIEQLYKPYHAALKRVHEVVQPTLVLSVHSFTPVYEGQKRDVEIGVLYNNDRDLPLAEKFVAAYQELGIKAALNEPWSAKDGYMFAADQFSTPHTAVIMVEFRQDLAVKADWRAKVVQATEKLLRENGHQ